MLRTDVAGPASLLEKLLDHPDGDPEAVGDFVSGTLVVVVGGKDAFAQIQRECAHVPKNTGILPERLQYYLNSSSGNVHGSESIIVARVPGRRARGVCTYHSFTTSRPRYPCLADRTLSPKNTGGSWRLFRRTIHLAGGTAFRRSGFNRDWHISLMALSLTPGPG